MSEYDDQAIEKLFPGLTKSLNGLDLSNPIAAGHLIAGRLGTLPLNVRQGLPSEKALETVKNFCEITGLQVTYDLETNTLDYPQLHQE